MRRTSLAVCLLCITLSWLNLSGQQSPAGADQLSNARNPEPAAIQRESQMNDFEAVDREIEQSTWVLRLGDVANVDFFSIASSKPIRMSNATGQGAGNPLIIYFYTFTPKNLTGDRKAPLMVFVHGGVHSRFETSYLHIIRELIQQGLHGGRA